MLMGGVEEEDGAIVAQLRVLQSDYENPDEAMLRKAFDFAVHLLQSAFTGVVVEESSASVMYEDDLETQPDDIVTVEKLHGHLEAMGVQAQNTAHLETYTTVPTCATSKVTEKSSVP
jgi:hypothetical protein